MKISVEVQDLPDSSAAALGAWLEMVLRDEGYTVGEVSWRVAERGSKHVVVVKHIATGYVTAHWIYDDLDWARWKRAELAHHDRRERQFAFAIVSL